MMINRVFQFTALACGIAAFALASGSPASAHKRGYSHAHKNGVVVKAPHAHVKTSRRYKRTRVRAPYTSVDVDRRSRIVSIRVPFYSADIRY